MSIKYSLIPNNLTSDPEDHMAVVQDQASRTIDDIIDEIADRGSTVTKADILSVVEEYQAVIAKFLKNGDRLNTPLFRTSASISGVFEDQTDSFDRSRHYVRLNVNPGPRIGEIAEDLPVEKVAATRVEPVLELFKDFASDTQNDTVTPGGAAELRGSYLKVDPSDANQGIFFIASDGTETKADTIMRNKPANLIFMVPDTLISGEYEVEVRSLLQGHTNIRSGRLNANLVVA
ncbi:DNA-binding domain-containing protein [Fodinibius sp. SL11]|uniref:HU family DNA-binding protein n=1 Tax=Fodinibius sp. SL11 TaxID=3425690 RepID=UPI003F8844BB